MHWITLFVALAWAEDAPEATPDAPIAAEAVPVEIVEAEPPFVAATGAELVTEAWVRIDRGDWEGARIVAELALTRGPEVQDTATAALGASWELDGHPERAIPLYEQVLTTSTSAELQDHMRFRIAESYGQLGQPDEALRRLEALAASREWDLADTLKISLLRGVWQLETGDRKGGLRTLTDALRDAPPDESAFHQAQARAALASVFCADAAALPLDGRQRKAVKNLEKRAALVGRAEQQVIGAIRLQEPEWALEGLLQVGGAYERIADDLLAMPIPRDIDTPDLRVAYDGVLRERVEILYVKAGKYYEQGLDLAVRLSWRSRRIAQLEDSLGAVQHKVDALASARP